MINAKETTSSIIYKIAEVDVAATVNQLVTDTPKT